MLNHYEKIDMNTWPQKPVFDMFSKSRNSYFEVCIKLRVRKAKEYAKKNGVSFYFVMCWLATKTCNDLINWRHRLVNNEVVLYDEVSPSCTDRNPDEAKFHIVDWPYDPSKSIAQLAREIQAASRECTGMVYNPMNCEGPGNIYFTSLPWLDFTCLVNLQPDDQWNGCPSICFGKFTPAEDDLSMPVSIQVNHLLLDGADVGEWAAHMQKLIDELN